MAHAYGGVVVDMPVMGYIKHNASRMGYTLQTESQKKKNEYAAKVTLWERVEKP